ncbi:hypothetical protein EBR21_01700 [bacterium]|nr:hypothetical protein [bacterium]
MNELIPQRVELFHPLVVHFPIALLLTGSLARLLLLFFEKREFGKNLRWIFLWSWTLGSLGSIAAYLSGEEAEDVVNKMICDPTITHDHSDFALYTLCLAWAVLIIAAVRLFLSGRLKEKIEKSVLRAPNGFRNLVRGVLVGEIIAVAATVGLLVWTGHLGGKLVYEQGAGYLRTPNENCSNAEAGLPPAEDNESKSSLGN